MYKNNFKYVKKYSESQKNIANKFYIWLCNTNGLRKKEAHILSKLLLDNNRIDIICFFECRLTSDAYYKFDLPGYTSHKRYDSVTRTGFRGGLIIYDHESLEVAQIGIKKWSLAVTTSAEFK